MPAALLLADDSETKLMLLERVLGHAKWPGDIVVARTTDEAEALIAAHDIGFAFVDYYMPSKNGPAVIHALKAKHPAAHVVLVSSSDRQHNIDEAMAAGAEGFVCTTWQADRVESALLGVIDEWRTGERV